MEKKLKDFCEREYNDLVNYYSASIISWDDAIKKAIDRCYGAMRFCTNNCFPEYNNELGEWWDNEMLPKFLELF